MNTNTHMLSHIHVHTHMQPTTHATQKQAHPYLTTPTYKHTHTHTHRDCQLRAGAESTVQEEEETREQSVFREDGWNDNEREFERARERARERESERQALRPVTLGHISCQIQTIPERISLLLSSDELSPQSRPACILIRLKRCRQQSGYNMECIVKISYYVSDYYVSHIDRNNSHLGAG